jgi:hypothetical protein
VAPVARRVANSWARVSIRVVADEIHVMPGKHGWEVREAGTFEPVSAHPSPEDAHAAGRELARREGVELVVHDANGEILARERPTPE